MDIIYSVIMSNKIPSLKEDNFSTRKEITGAWICLTEIVVSSPGYLQNLFRTIYETHKVIHDDV